jgi:hypothetical protein
VCVCVVVILHRERERERAIDEDDDTKEEVGDGWLVCRGRPHSMHIKALRVDTQ